MSLNEEDIFKNDFLVVVKMKSGTMKVVNIKFPKKNTSNICYWYEVSHIVYMAIGTILLEHDRFYKHTARVSLSLGGRKI